MPIETPADLRAHIELAIAVELSTIPPYLYAAYSIVDQGSEPALLIKSIVVEEMLHATLAANLLVAVGGRSPFGGTELMPAYPMPLPHHVPELMLDLEPCSDRLIRDTLMVIEQPEAAGATPQEDNYESLGQFYEALEAAVRRLAAAGDLFAEPQVARQLTDPAFYSPVAYDSEDSGGLMAVTDVETAIEAMEIIVHQGEGLGDHRWADPAHHELTHYYKLKQIHEGVSPLGDVHPAMTNPTPALLPERLRPVAALFDAAYRMTYLTLDQLYQPLDDKRELVGRLYRLMSEVLNPVARYLMAQPLGDGRVAGPTFTIHEFDSDPIRELGELADRTAAQHPELAAVADAIGRL